MIMYVLISELCIYKVFLFAFSCTCVEKYFLSTNMVDHYVVDAWV